jgi:hypothetical protein
MYFLLEAKGMNDNGYLLTRMIDLIISQIEHLVKLNFKIPPSQIG